VNEPPLDEEFISTPKQPFRSVINSGALYRHKLKTVDHKKVKIVKLGAIKEPKVDKLDNIGLFEQQRMSFSI